jgi:Fe-Mn family superoxide dismutase
MIIHRRALLAGATTLAATAVLPRIVQAQTTGPFTLPPLPYATNVFEPNIRRQDDGDPP